MSDNDEKTVAITEQSKESKLINQLVGQLDAAFNAEAEILLDAGEKKKAASFRYMLQLKRIYGNQTMWSFPAIGTEEKKDRDGEGPWHYYLEKVDKDGEEKEEVRDFYAVWVNRSPLGVQYQFIISQCKLALGKDADKAEVKYQQMDDHDLLALQNKMEQRILALRRDIKSAVTCFRQMAQLTSLDEDRVGVEVHLKSNGELQDTPTPVSLLNNKMKRKSAPLSVSDINRLKIDHAVKVAGENGDLYMELLKTLKKAPKKKAQTGTAKYPLASTVDQCWDAMNVVTNFLDWESETGRDRVEAMQTRLTEKGGDEILLAIGRMHDAIWNQLMSDTLKARLSRLKDARNANRPLDDAAIKAA